MIVTRYGLHQTQGGITFLVQPAGAQNLVVDGLPSPFEVRYRYPRFCTHEIDLSRWVEAPAWVDDPLVQAFLPTPGGGAYVIRNADRRYDALVRQLVRLSSSRLDMLRVMAGTDVTFSRRTYEATNLGPVVWFCLNMDQADRVAHQAQLAAAYDRRVIFVANGPFPYFNLPELTTSLTDLSDQPLEQIGAGVLRETMLHGYAPFHRPPDHERGVDD